MEEVVSQSVHTASPTFVGHMTSAIPYFMLPLSKIMVALNQNLVKIETSKAFTPLERQVLAMLHGLVFKKTPEFYKNCIHSRSGILGNLTSGGTVANITALWLARNRALSKTENFLGIREIGLAEALAERGYKGCRVFVSNRGHYSFGKACDLIGLGKRGLVSVKTDSNHKISLDDLESQLSLSIKDSFLPLAIVGIAGTTETGNVDDLCALADLALKYNVHYHVDAAWGGPVLFSEEHSHLLKGIEKADSVTIDAHKQLYVPMGAGFVLFKEPSSAQEISQQAEYILRKGSRDLGKYALEGSRPGMSVLVHSALKIIGRKGYELLIDHGLMLAKLFADEISRNPSFELISQPELNLLTYRYIPASLKRQLTFYLQSENKERVNEINLQLDTITKKIQKRQRSEGKSFVSRTRIPSASNLGKEVTVFRVALANPLTTIEILKDILKEQMTIGCEAWAANEHNENT